MTVLAVSTAQAATIFVDAANCPGPGDGSVGDPYCSIQDAIDNAVGTDEIVVAAGTYFEMINFLGKAITVRSTDPQDPVVVANTIIDGTGHFHVVQCVSGEGPDTVLEGFVITGGNANSFPDNNFGGGMYNNNSNPTVTNCTFSENSADFRGGGMYNSSSTPTVTDCTFCGNSPEHIDGDPVVLVGQIQMSTFCPIPVCPGDITGDGEVGINDFLDLLAAWGPCP